MKFDYVAMNPPYQKGLHLKILERVSELAKSIVNLSPVSWLLDPFRELRPTYKKFSILLDKTESIEIIPSFKARNIFNIESTSLGIYLMNEDNKVPYKIKSIDESIFSKLRPYMLEHQLPIEENKKEGWRVKWMRASGNYGAGSEKRKVAGEAYFYKLKYFYNGMKDGKPWYDFYSRNQHSKQTPELPYSIKFNSEEEAKNFCSFTLTHFGKYVSEKTIVGQEIPKYCLPWMEDYTEPWTDEKLFKFFKLTNEESKYITDFVDNWYERYK